jgi:hypothetical protein
VRRQYAEIIESLKEKEIVYDPHDIALDELSASLWHPVLARFRRLRHRRLTSMSKDMEAVRRDLYTRMQQIHVHQDKFVGFIASLQSDE